MNVNGGWSNGGSLGTVEREEKNTEGQKGWKYAKYIHMKTACGNPLNIVYKGGHGRRKRNIMGVNLFKLHCMHA
jgi:hypothetical protein